MAHSNKSLILVTFRVERSYFSGVEDKRSYTYRKVRFNDLVIKAYQTMNLPYSFLDNLEENYQDFSEEDHNRSIPYSYYSKRIKDTYQVFRVVNGKVVQFNLDGVRKLAIQKWLERNSKQPRKRKYYTRYPNPYRRGPVAYTRKYRSFRTYLRHPHMRNMVIQNTDTDYKEFRDPDYRIVQDGWYRNEGKYERRGSKSWKKNTKCRKQYEKNLK